LWNRRRQPLGSSVLPRLACVAAPSAPRRFGENRLSSGENCGAWFDVVAFLFWSPVAFSLSLCRVSLESHPSSCLSHIPRHSRIGLLLSSRESRRTACRSRPSSSSSADFPGTFSSKAFSVLVFHRGCLCAQQEEL
ncbi:hypothetical protein TGPRC2_215920C, partial [Toxoplasma gondii TgCatPRC2]